MNDELLDAELESSVWFLAPLWFSGDLKEDIQSAPEREKKPKPPKKIPTYCPSSLSGVWHWTWYSVTHLPIHPTLQGYKSLREGLRQTCLISTEERVSQDSTIAYVVVASGWVSRATLVPSCPCYRSVCSWERQSEAFSPTGISTPTKPVGA